MIATILDVLLYIQLFTVVYQIFLKKKLYIILNLAIWSQSGQDASDLKDEDMNILGGL